MFVITRQWVWDNHARPDLFARRFVRSTTADWKVKWSRDYSVRMMKKLAITDDEDDAIAEATMSFIVDTHLSWEGKEFPTEHKASNYLHGAFRYWFFNKVRDTPETRVETLPIESITQGVMMQNTTMKLDNMDQLRKAIEFADKAGEEAAFIFRYLLMTKQEQGQFWINKRNSFRFPNGTTLSKMTYYARVNKFKSALAGYLLS